MLSKTLKMQLESNIKCNRQAGFSLIELVIAMLLFTIVTGAVYGLLEAARSDRFTTNERVEIMQGARNALNAIGRDALNAGYGFPQTGASLPHNALSTIMGLPARAGTSLDLLTAVVAGPAINTNNLTGLKTDQVTFVFQDFNFNGGQPVNVTNITPSGSQVTIALSGGVTNSIFLPNDLYVITGSTSSAIGMETSTAATDKVLFASSDPLGVNTPSAASGPIGNVPTPAAIYRIGWVTYRVLANGTLVRTVYGNGTVPSGPTGLQDQPLAYNVENMKVQYVMADGTTSNSPAAGPDGILGTADDVPANLQNVRQVIVTLTVRSPENDRRNNTPYRLTLSSTFDTRNLGYDRR